MSKCAAAGSGNGARLRHCAPCVFRAREPQRLIVAHETLGCRKRLAVAHADNLADSTKAGFKAFDFAGTCDAAVRQGNRLPALYADESLTLDWLRRGYHNLLAK